MQRHPLPLSRPNPRGFGNHAILPQKLFPSLLLGACLVISADVAARSASQAPTSNPQASTGLAGASDAVKRLAEEVRNKGWIAYGARTEQGDWDLFLCRPDGSEIRNLTKTPEFNESAPQFSRDGRKLLYRRMGRNENLDNNRHGEQGVLVLAKADGTSAEVLGKPGELPWASFSPDGTQLASLSIKGISIYDLEKRQVVRTLPRKGFFQQMTWSPDGKWLVGVANSFGASWSIGKMDLTSGEATAVNRVDCCTPDWFPDSGNIIFSWRPPGQKANKGYGWTQLWRATADGTSRELVYAEDGRHVYGGNVSPDGFYVLFTGNVQEDGDPGRAGAPMALMRLSDAPTIAGESKELRALHPQTKDGPVLTLPAGWEPCWTFAEVAHRASAPAEKLPSSSAKTAGATRNDAGALASELHDHGRLVFSAATQRGDWDLFLMRPDGSDRRQITATGEFNEAGARFSPDGKRLLYYRVPKAEAIDNNTYGTFALVLSDADGANPVVFGKGFHWASWSPDSSQLACLSPKAIQIVEIATRKIIRELPRKGIVQQLSWSPDGKRFVGTANGLGPFWNIGCLDARTGEMKAISETERYNCTPDWTPDSQHVVYARGIIPQVNGRAELWVATADGSERHALYAEEGRHIYGACASPDGKYLLFTRSIEDLGKVDHIGTVMAVVRWADTPMAGDKSDALDQRFPTACHGPRLDLGPGWEPHWTLAGLTSSGK